MKSRSKPEKKGKVEIWKARGDREDREDRDLNRERERDIEIERSRDNR